jgi:porin
MQNMTMYSPLTVLLLLLLLATAPVVAADEGGDSPEAMTGILTALQDRGIIAEAVLSFDLLYNTHGGIERDGTILGNFDLTFEVNPEELGGWKDGTFFLYLLGNWNSGGLMSDKVGDLQVTSNIETQGAMRLYEAWYEHSFADDRVSLLVGLHDLNSEFDVIEYGSSFTHSAFGISTDISQIGPSIFPTTSVAARVKVRPTEGSYVLAAVYDGVPGNPNHPTRTTVRLEKDEGVFAVLEAGLVRSEPERDDYFKLGAGTWLHTAEVENFAGKMDDRNFGLYLNAEKKLFSESDSAEGLGAFVQLGFADEDRNQVAYYWGAGLHYTGLIPGRDSDVIGLAAASAWNGSEFVRFSEDVAMTPVEDTETTIELLYRAEVLPGLVLQPGVQYVVNPRMDPDVRNAWQVGLRLEMSF